MPFMISRVVKTRRFEARIAWRMRSEEKLKGVATVRKYSRFSDS